MIEQIKAMELRHIRYFLMLAETLNFSRAAEKLNIAQPALSKQIKDLEEEIGGLLFHRTTSKVQLTSLGHFFRQQTRKIIMQLDIAVTGAQQLVKGTNGTVKIGCDWATVGLPIAIAARILKKHNPRLAAEFIELPINEHVHSLLNHDIDIAFIPSSFVDSEDDLELRHVCNVSVKVILPENHQFSQYNRIRLDDLKNEHWLTLDSSNIPGYKQIMANVLQFQPKYGLSTSSMPALVAHVIAGNGIGLIPSWGRTVERGIVAVDVESKSIEIFAAYLNKNSSPLITAYLDALDQALDL